MVPMPQAGRKPDTSADLRATALRLLTVLAVALIVGLAARVTMGPPLF